MSQNKLKRPLLFTATAFIFLYPVCLAEVATGATSSYGLQPRKSLTPQTATTKQQQSLPKTSQGQLQSALESPSFSQTVESLQSTLNNLKAQLATLEPQIADKSKLAPTQALITQLQTQIDATKRLSARYTADVILLKAAVERYEAAKAAKATALTNFQTATANNDVALSELQAAQEVERQALLALNSKKTAAQTASQSLDQINQTLLQANSEATAQLTALEAASTAYDEAIQTRQDALTAKQAAQAAYDQALENYNTNLIPDPDWTAPTQQVAHTRLVPQTRTVTTTTLVPHTTTTIQEQVIPNILFNSDFSQGTSGWSGVNAGWQGSSPALVDGEIIFSYQNQTVSQGLYSGPFENATLTLSADWYNDDLNRNLADVYSMTIEAKDINQNLVGTATYNSTGSHGWERKSVTLTATGPVSYITVSFTGIDSGYWYGIYGPHVKNPTLRISHGQMVTETTYEEVTTTEEITEMVEETYYTTEVVQPQSGLTVRVYNQLTDLFPERSDTTYNLCKTTTLDSINHDWGGGDILGCGSDQVMIHYTGYITPTENITSLLNIADDGFFMSIDGVTAIDNWTLKGCSGNWNPVTLEAGKSYAIDAWFYEWGGGACSTLHYQSTTSSGIVPAEWYSNGASAPLIKDPSLLPALTQAELNLNQATQTFNEADLNVVAAATWLEEKQANYDAALLTKNAISSDKEAAVIVANQAAQEQQQQQAVYDAAEAELLIKTQNQNSSNLELTSSAAALEAATFDEDSAATTQDENYASTESSKKQYTDTFNEAIKTSAAAETSISTLSPDPIPEPEPEPEPTGSPDLPAELSAENLLSVDLEQVNPQELSTEQVEQLIEAALETFETAEQGSAEYEQALDALFLAAEADDIVVPEELAALPAIGPALAGAVELVNFLGNAGADMSPKVREESKKVVVTAVVAAGAAIQSAAAAASMSSASTRRIGN